MRLAADVHGGAHLAVNRTFNGKLIFQAAQTVTPSFLAEDIFILHDHRVHAAVQVEVRILQKLCLGETCHRVGGIGLTGRGIHISIIGLVHQVKKQIIRRIFLRAVQRGVLENMGQAGVIDCPREEGQIENPVEIAVGNIDKLRAGFVVFKKNALCADIGIGLNITDRKSADPVSGLREVAEFRLIFFRKRQVLHQFRHIRQSRVGGSLLNIGNRLFNIGRGLRFLLFPERASGQ